MGLGRSAVESLGMNAPDASFWRNRRVLLTGHTGFKGSWLALWLSGLGAKITGLALPPKTRPALFHSADVTKFLEHYECDIRDRDGVEQVFDAARPEIVIHLAAQPLVRASYAAPTETFETNILGTVNLLEACRSSAAVRVVVNVTTDKVYDNLERMKPYREGDALGGHDPYSASKAASEIVTASYRDSFLIQREVAVATARAGNVIGGGDWSEDRLLPDAARAWAAGDTLQVRRPDAVRPWQHVLEASNSYLLLAQALWSDPGLAGAYNFGPETEGGTSVRQIVELAGAAFGGGHAEYATAELGPHETSQLVLDVGKARSVLGISPRWSTECAVQRTMTWYRDFYRGASAGDLCMADIVAYGNEHDAPDN